ncbi:MAG: hypothetical protein U5M51_08295 [Emticicia sp.]|nr:hypothetical protein [Emticicia sp.]
MKVTHILGLFLLISASTMAQDKSKYIQLGGAFGSSGGSINLSAQKDWYLGKKDRIVIGTGLRFTSFFGSDVTLTTAPAKLSIEPKSVDSLLAPKPSISSLNLMINLGYKISDKIEVGFNIDALGLSFGPEGSPTFITNKKSTITKAKPTSPNILLVGDNDRGSLNSHFYGRYKLNEKIGLNVAYQFLFNELTTATKVQTSPEANDRFRVKSSQIFVGISYHF